MKKIMNDSQKALAEKYFHLVHQYLSRNGYLGDDGCYDAALNGFLLAVRAYDENVELREGYDFSAIAVRRMELHVKDYWQKEYRHRAAMKCVSLDSPVKGSPSMSLHEIFDIPQAQVQDMVEQHYNIQMMLSSLTPQEKQMFWLKVQGFGDSEMAETCGTTTDGIAGRLSHIKRKIMGFQLNVEFG